MRFRLYFSLVKIEKNFQFSRTTRRGRPRSRSAARRPREEAFLHTLAEAGYSDTRARRAVVHALCEANAGATPGDLLLRGRAIHSRLGPVTVYRTLDILRELGLVRRLQLEDGSSAYAASSRGHGHHVICRSCRRAVEFTGCPIDGVLASAANSTGYRVESHQLELFGLCPDCQGEGRRKK